MMTEQELYAAADLFQIGGMALDFPTPSVAEGFADGTLMADVRSCLEEMGAECAAAGSGEEAGAIGEGGETGAVSADALLEALKEEHSRLFANMRHPIIWIYETTFCLPPEEAAGAMLFVSADCIHVAESMKRAGVELAKGNRQPEDYFPTELQFLSYLCNAQAEGKPEVVQAGALVEFVTMHLSRWVLAFLDALMRETTMEEYRQLAYALAAGYRRLVESL